MGASLRVDTMDWQRVVASLRGAGLMNKEVAKKIGVSPQTVSNLLCGATREPCYSVGVKLLELREKHARAE